MNSHHLKLCQESEPVVAKDFEQYVENGQGDEQMCVDHDANEEIDRNFTISRTDFECSWQEYTPLSSEEKGRAALLAG